MLATSGHVTPDLNIEEMSIKTNENIRDKSTGRKNFKSRNHK